MKAKIYMLSLATVSVFALSSCDNYFSGMDIPNEYDPDIETVMADATQYPSLLTGVVSTYWNSMLSYGNECVHGLATNSDQFTAGAGNWNFTANLYYDGYEKQQIDNSNAASAIPKGLWFQQYTMINTIKNILVALDGGNTYLEGTEDYTYKIYANAYFLIGMVYAELSLIYDKGFPVTENVDASLFTAEDLKPSSDIRDLALSYLDKCIAICNEKGDFDNLTMFPDGQLSTGDKLKRMANFIAARALAYTPRTKAESANVDWNRVLTYAQNGIQEDMTTMLPNSDYDYWSVVRYAKPVGGWTRVNMRIFKMMCPDDPNAKWPLPRDFSSTDQLPELQSPDARLHTDFVYTPEPSTGAVSLAGYSRYSPYSLGRFNDWADTSIGAVYLFTKSECDLLLAEAKYNTGDKNGAATLVNITRVGRGQLPAATAGDADLLRKIYYERFIESDFPCPVTAFYDRRRTPIDEFQITTRSFRQYPVPKVELDNFGLETYTFGGAADEYPEYQF